MPRTRFFRIPKHSIGRPNFSSEATQFWGRSGAFGGDFVYAATGVRKSAASNAGIIYLKVIVNQMELFAMTIYLFISLVHLEMAVGYALLAMNH